MMSTLQVLLTTPLSVANATWLWTRAKTNCYSISKVNNSEKWHLWQKLWHVLLPYTCVKSWKSTCTRLGSKFLPMRPVWSALAQTWSKIKDWLSTIYFLVWCCRRGMMQQCVWLRISLTSWRVEKTKSDVSTKKPKLLLKALRNKVKTKKRRHTGCSSKKWMLWRNVSTWKALITIIHTGSQTAKIIVQLRIRLPCPRTPCAMQLSAKSSVVSTMRPIPTSPCRNSLTNTRIWILHRTTKASNCLSIAMRTWVLNM